MHSRPLMQCDASSGHTGFAVSTQAAQHKKLEEEQLEQCGCKSVRSYRAIVVHVQVLKGLHEATGHVACLGCLDCSVYQALTPAHGVEEELSGTEPTVERGGHKTLGCWGLVASGEVRQRSVLHIVAIAAQILSGTLL